MAEWEGSWGYTDYKETRAERQCVRCKRNEKKSVVSEKSEPEPAEGKSLVRQRMDSIEV